MRFRTAAAGQFDSGLSSLATFAVQVYATRFLEGQVLGAYALLFYSSLLATQVAALLVFAPTDVLATRVPRDHRLVGLHATVRWGAVHALPAALLAALGAIPALAQVEIATLVMLVTGAIAFAFLTPIQDHIRTMLHVAGRSGDAAKVSLAQLLTVLGAGLLFHSVDPALVPFGALAIANLVSATYGLLTIGSAGRGPRRKRDEVRTLGRWLFGSGAVNYGFSFLSSLVLERIVGLSSIGLLEAARVVARPVGVVGSGINAIIAPRAREAVSRGNHASVLRMRRWFWTGALVAGIGFLALFGFKWAFNPMALLVPKPFEVQGLVAASVVAASLSLLPQVLEAELLAGSRQKRLMSISVIAGFVQLIGAALATVFGLLAGPLSMGLNATSRFFQMLKVSNEKSGTAIDASPGGNRHKLDSPL